ncbi:MAG: pantoate--beta-alanine ligase [Alphaproteobacteria bacterium]|nr:pantoate--beta-alanine ligase [Alphaproteobacteria bacterium]
MTAWSVARRAEGARIGFVPTMGFLHEGHASLMARLRREVDVLVVSIFVNPLQFGPNEDLDRYPRDPVGDTALCEREGVDALFMPGMFYPEGFATGVSVAGLTDRLCGAARPGHFDGVTTVVARLFGVTRCDVACFGEKDYQQLAVIRRMVRDLALPVEIVGGPLIRDEDGLALSSRNKYLSPADRARGLSLFRALRGIRTDVDAGIADTATLRARALEVIEADRVDYLEIVDASSLEPLAAVDRQARALVAGFFGTTRLIDNVGLPPARGSQNF